MSEQDIYLTEAMLTIQHELQLALDYIETVISQETSSMGAAFSLVTMDSVRVRIPFIMEPEIVVRKKPSDVFLPKPGIRLTRNQLLRLKTQMMERPGLLLSEDEDRGRFAKIRVRSPLDVLDSDSGNNQASELPMIGEIEFTLSRAQRSFDSPLENTTEIQPTQPVKVPPLVGLNPAEAVRQLHTAKLDYQPHQASPDEIKEAPPQMQGLILRQEPTAGEMVDRIHIKIHYWSSPCAIQVDRLPGIGKQRKIKLIRIGIHTIGDFAAADSRRIATHLNINAALANKLIQLAKFLSDLYIAGIPEAAIGLLVFGAEIHKLADITDADPNALYATCQKAIQSKSVAWVPKIFKFTTTGVRNWIAMAAKLL